MRSIKMIGLGLVAVLVLAVSASAASAHEFSYSGTLETALLGEATTNQVFKAGFGTVTCTLLKVTNTLITKAKSETQLALIEYSMCSSSTGNKVKEPIVAHYVFNASGEVEVVEPIKFELEGLCTIIVAAQKLPEAVTYANSGADIKVAAKAKNIHYSSEGGFGVCGSGTTATYEGESLVSGDGGGALSWA